MNTKINAVDIHSEISEEFFEKIVGKNCNDFIPEWEHKHAPDRVWIKTIPWEYIEDRQCENDYHYGSCGKGHHVCDYYAVTHDGKVLPPPIPCMHSGSNYSYEEDIDEEGLSLIEAWGDQKAEIKFVIEYNFEYSDWRGYPYKKATELTLYICY